MGESVKQKGTVQNKKKNVSVTAPNMTLYEKDYIMSNLLNVLFEQVKLQQEVRDRWFGHYLTIIGALTALATLCLKIFEGLSRFLCKLQTAVQNRGKYDRAAAA